MRSQAVPPWPQAASGVTLAPTPSKSSVKTEKLHQADPSPAPAPMPARSAGSRTPSQGRVQPPAQEPLEIHSTSCTALPEPFQVTNTGLFSQQSETRHLRRSPAAAEHREDSTANPAANASAGNGHQRPRPEQHRHARRDVDAHLLKPEAVRSS